MATPRSRSGKIGNTEYEVSRNAEGQHTGQAITKKGNRETVTSHNAEKGNGPFKPWTRKSKLTVKEGKLPNGTKYRATKFKSNAWDQDQTDVVVKQEGKRNLQHKRRTNVSADQQRDGKARVIVKKESINPRGMRKSIPVKHRTSKGKK